MMVMKMILVAKVDGSGVSEILAPNNFGSALSKAALKGPLKAVIGRLQLSSWR